VAFPQKVVDVITRYTDGDSITCRNNTEGVGREWCEKREEAGKMRSSRNKINSRKEEEIQSNSVTTL
jgi:hypothetical protein